MKKKNLKTRYTPRKDGKILFFGRSRPYFEFSNFYPASFELDGYTWKTSEHYYMAQKTTNPQEKEKIRKAPTPGTAKYLGRSVKLRPNWDNIKFDIMYKACYAKFSQNSDLKELLLDTGNCPIHEDAPDPWWGGGPNYPNGKDLLGKVLIQVRSSLRERTQEN